jgi:hypothetical protein
MNFARISPAHCGQKTLRRKIKLKKYQPKRRKHTDEKFTLIFTARPNFMKKLDPNQDSGEPQNFQFHFEFAQILGGALGIALVTLALFWGLPHTLIMTQRLKLLGYNVQAQQHHMQSRTDPDLS